MGTYDQMFDFAERRMTNEDLRGFYAIRQKYKDNPKRMRAALDERFGDWWDSIATHQGKWSDRTTKKTYDETARQSARRDNWLTATSKELLPSHKGEMKKRLTDLEQKHTPQANRLVNIVGIYDDAFRPVEEMDTSRWKTFSELRRDVVKKDRVSLYDTVASRYADAIRQAEQAGDTKAVARLTRDREAEFLRQPVVKADLKGWTANPRDLVARADELGVNTHTETPKILREKLAIDLLSDIQTVKRNGTYQSFDPFAWNDQTHQMGVWKNKAPTYRGNRYVNKALAKMKTDASDGNLKGIALFVDTYKKRATNPNPGPISHLQMQSLVQAGENIIRNAPKGPNPVAIKSPEELRRSIMDVALSTKKPGPLLTLFGGDTGFRDISAPAQRRLAETLDVARNWQMTKSQLVDAVALRAKVPTEMLANRTEEQLRKQLATYAKPKPIKISPTPWQAPASAFIKDMADVEKVFKDTGKSLPTTDIAQATRRVYQTWPSLNYLPEKTAAKVIEPLVAQDVYSAAAAFPTPEDQALHRIKIRMGDAPTAPTTMAHMETLAGMTREGWRDFGKTNKADPDPRYQGPIDYAWKKPIQSSLKPIVETLKEAVIKQEEKQVTRILAQSETDTLQEALGISKTAAKKGLSLLNAPWE